MNPDPRFALSQELLIGFSTETIRRRLLADPSLGHKRGGRWIVDPSHLKNGASGMK
jgi:hypothetical protein